MELLVAALLVIMVVVVVRIRSAIDKQDAKNDSFVAPTSSDGSTGEDVEINKILSYEIPVPDTFEYHYRSGSRLSERQRSAKKARRAYDLYMLAERRRREEEEQQHALQEARRIGIRKIRQSNPAGYSNEWVVKLTKEQEGCCFWCAIEINDGDRHLDHVWPLSRGGFHDVANLVLSCGRCNLRKGARSPWAMVREDLDLNRQEIVWRNLLNMGIGATPTASRQTPQEDPAPQLAFDWTDGEVEIVPSSRAIFAEVDGKTVQLTFEFD